MKYYLHDTNSFNDEKITLLFRRFGYEGLGLFYTFLEKIAAQEQPIGTDALKFQLKVGKKLNKCWNYMEEIGLLSSNNGETFNKQLLNFSEKFEIKKEKNRKRVAQWRENQKNKESVTHYESVRNAPKVKESKVKESKDTSVVPFDKSKGCYQECISLYNQFLIDRTGAGVKMNGREGKSMNTIIEHLSRQDKIAGDKQKIIDAWNYILVNWDSLTTYHKNRVKLSNIDEDLSNILLQLKQKNNTPPNESTAEKFRDLIRSQSTGSVQQPNTVNDVFSSTQNGDGTQ